MKPFPHVLAKVRTVTLLTVLIFALALPGCVGYSHYFPMPPGAKNVKTVAIEIFKNKTVYQDIEFEFTEALQREICAKTTLQIAKRGNADALVIGSIDAYERVVLRENRADDVSRYSIVLTVSYEFRRLPARGESAFMISSADKVVRSAEYEVMSTSTEPSARAEAVRKIARKVVSHMFEQW